MNTVAVFTCWLTASAMIGPLARPVTLPQLPPRAECEARSWTLHHWAEFFDAINNGYRRKNEWADNPDATLLRDACRRDSTVWWNAARLQNPFAGDDARRQAQTAIIEAIGEQAFRGGTLPPVPPYPYPIDPRK